jgi:glycosyltransferase involved in cell wall biosynthesis
MKQKVIVKGPALSQSGYGEQTRFALRALKSRQDLFDIFLINIGWGKTNHIIEDNEERAWYDELLSKTMQYIKQQGRFDISIQITIPNEFEKMALRDIGYTAGIESTKVAPEWILKSNQIVDKLIVPSNHSKNVFESSFYTNQQTGQVIKIGKPIEVVNFPVRSHRTQVDSIDLNLSTDFNFLTISQWGPRKNLHNTIRWFVEENIDKNVGLVVKTNLAKNCQIDRDLTLKAFKSMLAGYKDRLCKVYLLHGYLTEKQMNSIYTNSKIKGLINLSHGEGFGLPIFEAAYHGLPVITTDWSGQVDYLYAAKKSKKGLTKIKPHFCKVDYDLQPIQKEAIWKGVLQKESMWAFPKEGSFKMKLREFQKDYGRFKATAKRLQKHILKTHSEENQYEKFINVITPAQDIANEPRVMVL